MTKILIVEDDLVSRKFLTKFLSQYGECDMVVDGLEAVEAYKLAVNEHEPYDLVCLDIMMPKIDGVKVLRAIRDLEIQNKIETVNRVKIIMTTALAESQIVQDSFELGCDAYASKPIDILKLTEVLESLEITK